MFAASKTAAVASAANYIEDVFSTYLYTGTSGSNTITNNIDISTKGGLLWLKNRTTGARNNFLFDTARGVNKYIVSNATDAETTDSAINLAFNTNGFSMNNSYSSLNDTGQNYASWTFRKQAKFFDVVTYTGNGANRTISHNLGSVPGTIIIKRTDTTGAWAVYHRSLANTEYLVLNTTAAKATGATYWNSTTPTSTEFSLGTATDVNANAGTYVAYLFAHDAGGFGAAGTDNVISCGSYTGNGSATGPVINLGYEPQWVLVKNATSAGYNWYITDTMRGFTVTTDSYLAANLADAELTTFDLIDPTSTGFAIKSTNANYNQSGATYIYIAIRRGPMKTPTSGTSVFGLNARTGTGANATVTGGQTDDAVLIKNRGAAVGDLFASRLTGTGYLETSSTAAEVAAGTTILQANPWDVMDGVKVGTTSTITNASANTFINYLFRRAPGFFDVVCYTGTGSNTTQTHNLGVVPELIFVKRRGATGAWSVYSAALANTEYLVLNTTAAKATGTTYWNSTTPTSTVFSLGTAADVNASTASNTYVAYLFATLAGVSKVGTYVGNATVNGQSQNIDCGFTAGARFVMIKCTSTTGDWYVFDSARGIVAGNDPFFFLNSTAAETTSLDCVDPYSQGFTVVQQSGGDVNVNNATYIFLAIA